MYNKKIARRYSTSIFEIALEQKKTDEVRKDFLLLKKTIESSKDLRLFLNSPVIISEKKLGIFKEIFKGNISDLTISFLNLVFGKRRESLLYDITLDFMELFNEKSGIIEAKIKTAVELNDAAKKNISDKLTQYTGKKIEASYSVDHEIKGGFIAQIEDTIIDASIRRQLELLHENFMKGNFRAN